MPCPAHSLEFSVGFLHVGGGAGVICGTAQESPAELPGGLGRQEWVSTSPLISTDADPASGLNVHPAPDQPLSLDQDEADQSLRLRGDSWVRMGVTPLLSGLLPVSA